MQILVTTKTRNGKCDAVQRLREKGQSERVYESEWSHTSTLFVALNGNVATNVTLTIRIDVARRDDVELLRNPEIRSSCRCSDWKRLESSEGRKLGESLEKLIPPPKLIILGLVQLVKFF